MADMADITTPTSATGPAPTAQPVAPSPNPPKPTIATPPVGSQPNTLSANNPLSVLGPQAINPPTNAPPMHSNDAINAALMQAFRPVIPDQINSLLGPAIGQIQGHTLPIQFYQPRQAPPISVRRSS